MKRPYLGEGGDEGGGNVLPPGPVVHQHRYLKVIRKFFLTHNKRFRWHLWDYEKHNFFSI